MACRKSAGEERGRPHRLLRGGSVGVWYTALEAREGKPGNGTLPEPWRRHGTRDRQAEAYGERASPPDASGESDHAEYSERGNATYQGQDVTEARKPTSLQGIADKATADQQHRFRDLYRGLNVELLVDCWGALHKDAASGVDGVTWHAYAAQLQAHVEAVVERLKQKRYRAQLIRRHDMPKGDGQERPLGLPWSEDTLLQAACASILNAISAQEFLASRYGDRPGGGAGDAVRDLTCDRPYGRDGSAVEADIQGFFGAPGEARRFQRVQCPPRQGPSQPTGNRVLGSWR